MICFRHFLSQRRGPETFEHLNFSREILYRFIFSLQLSRHPQASDVSKQHERAGHRFTLVLSQHGGGAAVLRSCGLGCCRVVFRCGLLWNPGVETRTVTHSIVRYGD